MSVDCTRCGRAVEGTDVRYTRRTPEAEAEHYCSLNCLADTDRFDEDAVSASLFDAVPAE